MQKKNIVLSISFLIIILACLGYCIHRDIQLEKTYTGDLRNRIVGARLQMDGKSPYFFWWHSKVDDRYYDPNNFLPYHASNVTGSPFLHQLLYPIANFPERIISRIWLFLEYFSTLCIIAFAFFFISKNNTQKIAVLIISTLFLLTVGWISHVYMGQYYIFIAFLFMVFYGFILQLKNIFFLIGAGIIAVCFLLLKPTSIFFLIPFIFIFLQLTSTNKMILISSIILPLVVYFSFAQNRLFWSDYRMALNEQINIHQYLSPKMQQNPPLPNYNNFEGWNFEEIKKANYPVPDPQQIECANIPILIKSKLHYKMTVWQMTAILIITTTLLLFIFYKNIKRNNSFQDINKIAIFGFCLYILSELFSPIRRYEYTFAQWVFPLVLVAAKYEKKYWPIYSLVLIGLFFNMLQIKSINSEHTVGEYLIIIAMFIYTFLVNKNDKISAVYS